MNVFQRRSVHRLATRLHIGDLPADHPINSAGGRADFGDDLDPSGSFERSARERLKSPRQQSVPRENSHRFPEYLMTRRLAAAQIVVIERRQVVMDQRIGMYELDRATNLNRARQLVRKHPRRCKAQNGPNALAAGKNAVAHGAVDRGRRRLLGRQKLLQLRLDGGVVRLKKIGELHAVREVQKMWFGARKIFDGL